MELYKITFEDSVTASQVELRYATTLTHPETDTLNEYGLHLKVVKLIIDSTSKIDVSGRGYVGDRFVGGKWRGARSLNNVIVPISSPTFSSYDNYVYGGSHGGLGYSSYGMSPAPIYGNALSPYTLGCGGGAKIWYYGYGGDGGGRVKIICNECLIDGVISADADSVPNTAYGAGGAGGSVWIDAKKN